jgi:hypothetical protein
MPQGWLGLAGGSRSQLVRFPARQVASSPDGPARSLVEPTKRGGL